MAQVAGTQDTYVTKGLREDLQDKIFLINKDDTPFISNIGSDKADAIKTEWQIDVLDPPDLNNAQIEGDTYAYVLPTSTSRVGNYCQIMRKTMLVSGTLEEVKKAGRASEMKYQAMKKGMALKRDMEGILLSAQASVAGSAAGASARRLGGFQAWLTTNVSRGAGGANGGFQSGTGLVSAPTAGTARLFTETQLKDAMQSAYANGGDPNLLMLPVPQKRNFSAFTGIAQTRNDVNNRVATIVAAADVYLGDFGRLSVVPNRQMANGTALGIDPKMAEVAYLRRLFVDKPAKDGDAWKRVLVTELTLKVLNEAAMFGVFDLQ